MVIIRKSVIGCWRCLRAAVNGKPAAPLLAGAKDALNRWRIRFSLPQNAMIIGTNPLGLLDELRDLGECRIVADNSAIPPLDVLVPTELHLS